MLPSSWSFAWILWRQHGTGFYLILGYLFLAGVVSTLLAPYCEPGTAEGALGLLLSLTLAAIPIYFLTVFAYGFDSGDLLARESCFPNRLFRLPVPTHSLVLWPIVFGTCAAIAVWFLVAGFLLRPWMQILGNEVPLWWPAAFFASALAWLQALLWLPVGLRWLRMILIALLVPLLSVSASLSAQSSAPEALLVLGYVGLTVVAWMVAFVGVRQGRCGDAPNWEAILQPFQRIARYWPRRRASFVAPAQAQVWFEWRLGGRSLTISTAMLLSVSLWPLYYGGQDLIPIEQTLLGALAVPIFLAGMFGAHGGGNNPGVKGRIGLGLFNATLPMRTGDMIAAMFKVAALSTLAAWAVAAVMVPTALLLTGHLSEVVEMGRQAIGQYGLARFVVLIVAVLTLLLVATWRRHIDRLYWGLTGQVWVTYSVTGVFLTSVGLCILAVWLSHRPETHATIFAVLPWILGPLVLCRFAVAIWALREVLRRDLVQGRTVARWVTAWVLLASLLFAALAWTVPTERVPIYYLAFGVLFAMPMARLAATPLALSYNRHR